MSIYESKKNDLDRFSTVSTSHSTASTIKMKGIMRRLDTDEAVTDPLALQLFMRCYTDSDSYENESDSSWSSYKSDSISSLLLEIGNTIHPNILRYEMMNDIGTKGWTFEPYEDHTPSSNYSNDYSYYQHLCVDPNNYITMDKKYRIPVLFPNLLSPLLIHYLYLM